MAKRMAAYEKDNELLRNKLNRLEEEGIVVTTNGDEQANPNERSAQGLLPPLAKPPPPPRSIPRPHGNQAPSGGSAKGLAGLKPPEPKIIRVSFTQVKDNKDELLHPHINETLPAGTFVNAVMLNGLAAPTGNLGQRNPHPILLELVDYGNLPNRFSHRVKSCRVIAAGHGELSDERAYIRLERLSCVLRSGEVISKEAKGYITGEDGKNGLAGLLVTKQGAFVARSLLAGIFSGLGRAIGQSYSNVSTSALGTVESIDPSDVGKAGVAEGISTATERVADWYLERADEVFPFVEIEAGRIVTVTFTEDIDLDANMIEKHVP
jgi:conjugal transfer pilus assembly protein TraB